MRYYTVILGRSQLYELTGAMVAKAMRDKDVSHADVVKTLVIVGSDNTFEHAAYTSYCLQGGDGVWCGESLVPRGWRIVRSVASGDIDKAFLEDMVRGGGLVVNLTRKPFDFMPECEVITSLRMGRTAYTPSGESAHALFMSDIAYTMQGCTVSYQEDIGVSLQRIRATVVRSRGTACGEEIDLPLRMVSYTLPESV